MGKYESALRGLGVGGSGARGKDRFRLGVGAMTSVFECRSFVGVNLVANELVSMSERIEGSIDDEYDGGVFFEQEAAATFEMFLTALVVLSSL